jgi:methyltransferase (TIGR00027 family)
MKPGEASSTAEFNALFRAIESSRYPARKRLFEDPLAKGFLGHLKYAYLLSRLPLAGRLVPLHIDRKWPGVRASHIGRTCWIDDRLRAALRDGVGQVVILGAGYDCRAYRLADMKRTHVFELDHPSTLKMKVERLRHLLGAIPENITFVAIDFDRQSLSAALESSGFERSIPTFFILEGLLHYLTAEAVDETLRNIASLSAPRSKLLFTYIHRGLLDGSVSFGEMGHVPATLRKSGENWTFGLDPAEIPNYLTERGFELLCDIGSTEYRALYLGTSGRHLRGFEFYRTSLAEVRK